VSDSHVTEILAWLERNRAELERHPIGHLEIDWGNETVTYTWQRTERVKRRAVRQMAG
jgi:hypothetical protein